jgi:hypothetical protein
MKSINDLFYQNHKHFQFLRYLLNVKTIYI